MFVLNRYAEIEIRKQAQSSLERANILYYKNNFPEAEIAYHEAILNLTLNIPQADRAKEDWLLLASCQYKKAKVVSSIGDAIALHHHAIESLGQAQALAACEDSDFIYKTTLLFVKSQLWLADLYQVLSNNNDDAMACAQLALSECEKLISINSNDTHWILMSRLQLIIGTVFYGEKNPEWSNWIQKAVMSQEKVITPSNAYYALLLNTRQNIARIYKQKNSYEGFKMTFDQALTLVEEIQKFKDAGIQRLKKQESQLEVDFFRTNYKLKKLESLFPYERNCAVWHTLNANTTGSQRDICIALQKWDMVKTNINFINISSLYALLKTIWHSKNVFWAVYGYFDDIFLGRLPISPAAQKKVLMTFSQYRDMVGLSQNVVFLEIWKASLSLSKKKLETLDGEQVQQYINQLISFIEKALPAAQQAIDEAKNVNLKTIVSASSAFVSNIDQVLSKEESKTNDLYLKLIALKSASVSATATAANNPAGLFAVKLKLKKIPQEATINVSETVTTETKKRKISLTLNGKPLTESVAKRQKR